MTIVVAVGSALLFAYWFRYTCLLILSAKTARDYAGDVAKANQLSFLEIQAELRAEGPADLDRLQKALDKDYALVSYLIRHAAGGEADSGLEDRMLQLNYRLTRAWYRSIRRISPEIARRALDEMSTVVAHLANAVGQRAAVSVSA